MFIPRFKIFRVNNVPMSTYRSFRQIDVSFSCVCPVIDHDFHQNIVKVAVDPRGAKAALVFFSFLSFFFFFSFLLIGNC